MQGELRTDGEWPAWARPQLVAAIEVAGRTHGDRPLASELYERWFRSPAQTASRSLVGEYRRAHAGVATSVVDGLPVLDRHDRIGSDGWWRTWNTLWRPEVDGPRVLFTPHEATAAQLVGELTAGLRDVPYVIAAPRSSAGLARSGAVVLHLPQRIALSRQSIAALAPLLRADTPPLCLPVAPGIAVAQYPDNGMTFGEHRCHLVAMAIELAGRWGAPAMVAEVIAEVFRAHGVDPARPYRSARGRS